jgi:4-carboxymuconolactone decarboxylase
MSRLPRITAAAGDVAERIRLRRGGSLRPVDEMLLHSPQVADGWNSLLGAVRGATTLSDDVSELVVMRVAALTRAEYEWQAHREAAAAAGLSPAQTDALRRADAADGGFDERQRAVLALTDAMTSEIKVSAELFAQLSLMFDSRQLLELVAMVAAYNMVTRFVVALEL